MITLDNLTFSYRRHMPAAVSSASASIPDGLHLLLGENGAGKTTLLHLIAGLQRPDEGQCLIDGSPVWPRNPSAQSRMFFLPDTLEPPFDTMADMARLHGAFYTTFSADEMTANLASFGLDAGMKLRRMSLGMRRKAMLSYALSLHADVLLLDEPANGLDIDSRKELRRMIGRSVAPGQTVIVSTHMVHDLEPLFDGLIMLSQSKLLLDSPVWEIASRFSFVTTTAPTDGALYQEPDGPRFRAITVGDGSDETSSDIDYTLLYSAIMSPSRDAILNHINGTDNDQ